MMWGYGYGGGWWGPVLLGVTGLLVWAVLIIAVIALLRWSRSAPTTEHPAGPDARQVLDERFARGEIDPDEYASRRRVLEGR